MLLHRVNTVIIILVLYYVAEGRGRRLYDLCTDVQPAQRGSQRARRPSCVFLAHYPCACAERARHPGTPVAIYDIAPAKVKRAKILCSRCKTFFQLTIHTPCNIHKDIPSP